MVDGEGVEPHEGTARIEIPDPLRRRRDSQQSRD
jgi:hypothetical protein